MNLDQFVNGYAVAALWSSCGPDSPPYQCENLDDLFDVDDIAPETMAKMREDCADFIKANEADLREYESKRVSEQWSASELAGHDFWLTRNGHGCGFWDRGLGELGQRLTDAAQVYKGVDLYPGDDGKVYA